MRRTLKPGTKARLSFSGGPHAPVNMADSMENGGSWTVSESKKATTAPKDFKDLRKLGVRNIAQYSAANGPFPAFSPNYIHFIHLSAMSTGASGPPEKLRPCPDLVPVPAHCSLALKGMLFRHRGALSFVSICCGVAILSPPQLQITGKHGQKAWHR